MKTFADVTDPWTKELADRVKANSAMVNTILSLHFSHGMGVTNYYGDGVVRMAEGDGLNDLACFVRPDGTMGPIHSVASLIACAEIAEMRKKATV